MLLYIVHRENAHHRRLDGAGQQYLDQEVFLVKVSFESGKTECGAGSGSGGRRRR